MFIGGSRIAVLLTENANGINIWYFIGYLICAGLLGIHAGLKEEVRQI